MTEEFFAVRSTEKVESDIIYTIEINKDHPVFEGHFPDLPVAPGVLLVDMIRKITQQDLDCTLSLKEANNIKFLKPVLPVEKNIFSLQLKITEEDLVKVVAVCSADEEKYFKMSAKFQRAE